MPKIHRKPNGTWVAEIDRLERLLADWVGWTRKANDLGRGYLEDIDGLIRTRAWEEQREGAAAELCVAAFTGQYWHALVEEFRFLPADVGTNIEVRQTDLLNGSLIVRPDQRKPDARYVLVIGGGRIFRLMGWCPDSEVEERGELGDKGVGRPDAFWIPQEKLELMETLDE